MAKISRQKREKLQSQPLIELLTIQQKEFKIDSIIGVRGIVEQNGKCKVWAYSSDDPQFIWVTTLSGNGKRIKVHVQDCYNTEE